MSPIDFHRFGADRRRASQGDLDAAENYERLALLADDPEQAAAYLERATEARASSKRNLDAINARLQGRKAAA